MIEIADRRDASSIVEDQANREHRSVAGARALIVDDSRDNRELLRLFLNRHGVLSDFATNGREAVESAFKKDFDFILMDIQMPEMDGYAALKELNGKGYEKPVIAFTAHAMKEEREKAFEAGFKGHITKPVSEAALLETIARFYPGTRLLKNKNAGRIPSVFRYPSQL